MLPWAPLLQAYHNLTLRIGRGHGCLRRQWYVVAMPERAPIQLVAGITIDLQPVAIGIIEVHCPTDEMINCGNLNPGLRQRLIRFGELAFTSYLKGDVIESCRVRWRCERVRPNVLQRDLMVECAAGQKGVLFAHALRLMQPQESLVKGNATIQVAHFQVGMADFRAVHRFILLLATMLPRQDRTSCGCGGAPRGVPTPTGSADPTVRGRARRLPPIAWDTC